MKTCPACQQTYPDEIESCPRDGARLAAEVRDERECPCCAEKILKKAAVCKHCGHDVEPQAGTDTAVQPPPPALPGRIIEPPTAPQGSKPAAARAPESRATSKSPRKMKFAVLHVASLICELSFALILIIAVVGYFSQPADKNPNPEGRIKKGEVSSPGKAGPSQGEVRVNPKDGIKYVRIPPDQLTSSGLDSAIVKVIEKWVATTKNGDLEGRMALYGDRLDIFYTKPNLSRANVEREIRTAMGAYYSLPTLELSNVTWRELRAGVVQVEFDKDYTAIKRTGGWVTGRVHSMLTLVRTRESWSIIGERDLKVYAKSQSPQPKSAPSSEYPAPNIREEQKVTVDGVSEIWRLQWMTIPKPACEPNEDSLSCPCAGFAYGEAGALDLVRFRDGAEIDRLPLTPLFTGNAPSQGAVIQRWEIDDQDYKDFQRQDFPLRVSERPTVQVMHFGDYDHTGWKNEFYLQGEAIGCHTDGFVVGVSKRNLRLHALGAASSSSEPLNLSYGAWEALRGASGPIEVLDWQCGVLDYDSYVRLGWTANGITWSWRKYTCPPDHKLIDEVPIK